MGRILLYGPLAVIVAIGSWFYYRGEEAPDTLAPIMAVLLAVMSFGYAQKAQEDGDIGAGNGKIRREKNPRLFKIALYFTYLIAVAFVVTAVYLLVG